MAVYPCIPCTPVCSLELGLSYHAVPIAIHAIKLALGLTLLVADFSTGGDADVASPAPPSRHTPSVVRRRLSLMATLRT